MPLRASSPPSDRAASAKAGPVPADDPQYTQTRDSSTRHMLGRVPGPRRAVFCYLCRHSCVYLCRVSVVTSRRGLAGGVRLMVREARMVRKTGTLLLFTAAAGAAAWSAWPGSAVSDAAMARADVVPVLVLAGLPLLSCR